MPEVAFHVYGGRQQLAPRFAALLDGDRPTALFVKPVRGAMGKGLFRPLLGNGRVELNGRSLGRDEFLRQVLELRRDMIGTVGVEQHATATSWFPGAVNTLRILAIRAPGTREPAVVLAALRVGTAATAPIDNFSHGGLSFPVDIATGTIGRGVQRHPKGVTPVDRHPETGAAIAGTDVPHWREIVGAMLRAMNRLPYLLYVGWDVAIGPQGPIVIEGNSYSGVDVFQVHAPVLACEPLRRFYEHHGLLRIEGPVRRPSQAAAGAGAAGGAA